MQVLFRGTYWMRQWIDVAAKGRRRIISKQGCSLLDVAMMQIFAKNDWIFSNRLCLYSVVWWWPMCSECGYVPVWTRNFWCTRQLHAYCHAEAGIIELFPFLKKSFISWITASEISRWYWCITWTANEQFACQTQCCLSWDYLEYDSSFSWLCELKGACQIVC
jgi:hypothetical protein